MGFKKLFHVLIDANQNHEARLDILWSLNIPGHRTAQTQIFCVAVLNNQNTDLNALLSFQVESFIDV